MAVLTRKVTKPQREWLKSYEKTTGFEPMHQEELDRTSEKFADVVRRNLTWFQDWAQESVRHLERELDEAREKDEAA